MKDRRARFKDRWSFEANSATWTPDSRSCGLSAQKIDQIPGNCSIMCMPCSGDYVPFVTNMNPPFKKVSEVAYNTCYRYKP